MGFVLGRGVQIGGVAINAVGNVTITDGEATGFSATSILQTAQPLDLSNTSYEIHCRFKCTSVSSENVIFRNKDLGGLTATIYNGYIYLYPQTVGQSSSTEWQLWSISNNIIYDFAVKREENTFYISVTNVLTGTVSSTTKTATNLVSSTTDGFCFGGGSASLSSRYLRGTIYTYYTYIMVNGELWAGQNGTGLVEPSNIIIDDGANQTEANYLIVDNKLVWANPQIYLQNNSNWNAYINTGIVPTNDMRFDVTAQITDTANTWDGTVFGERNANNAAQTGLLLWHNTNLSGWGSFCYGQGWNGNWNNLTPSIKGTKNRFKYDGSFLIINGQIPTTGNWISKSSFSTTYPIFLYGFNNTGSLENRRFHGRIYNATFWSGSTKLAEFVPVPAGMTIGNYTTPSAGMWDIVSQQFYANAGSGTFTWGKDQ